MLDRAEYGLPPLPWPGRNGTSQQCGVCECWHLRADRRKLAGGRPTLRDDGVCPECASDADAARGRLGRLALALAEGHDQGRWIVEAGAPRGHEVRDAEGKKYSAPAGRYLSRWLDPTETVTVDFVVAIVADLPREANEARVYAPEGDGWRTVLELVGDAEGWTVVGGSP